MEFHNGKFKIISFIVTFRS